MVSGVGGFVVGEEILLRSTVAVGEGGGKDRSGDVVDFQCCCHHFLGDGSLMV